MLETLTWIQRNPFVTNNIIEIEYILNVLRIDGEMSKFSLMVHHSQMHDPQLQVYVVQI
jgi:hypothetical protein